MATACLLNAAELAELGGKASGLAVASSAGFDVPPTSGLIWPEQTSMDEWLDASAREICRWAEAQSLEHLVVRSSTVADKAGSALDGLSSSFAVPDSSAVRRAISQVCAGRPTTRDESRRAANGASSREYVLVQPTVPPSVSGISRTHSRKPSVTTESTWGLSLLVREGLAGGDRYHLGGDSSPRHSETRLARKHLGVFPASSTDSIKPGDLVTLAPRGPATNACEGKILQVDFPQGLAFVRMPSELAEASSLSTELAERIESAARVFEECLDGPIAFEWVWTPARALWIVQLNPADEVSTTLTDSPAESSRTIVIGEPGAPGRHRGRLCPVGSTQMAEGDVVLTGAASPAVVPFLLEAGAVISTDSGSLSHIAILARELGLPCVLSSSIPSDWIAGRLPVDVDGTNGTVTLATDPPLPVHRGLDRKVEDNLQLQVWPGLATLTPTHGVRMGGTRSTIAAMLATRTLSKLAATTESGLLELVEAGAGAVVLLARAGDSWARSLMAEARARDYSTMTVGPWMVLFKGTSDAIVQGIVTGAGVACDDR